MIMSENKILNAFKNRQRTLTKYVVLIDFEGIFFLYYRRVLFLETFYMNYVF